MNLKWVKRLQPVLDAGAVAVNWVKDNPQGAIAILAVGVVILVAAYLG